MISHVHHSFHLAEQVTDEDTTVGPPPRCGGGQSLHP